MDQQAVNLLATLKKPAAPSEAKVNALNALKSDIKHYRVPESAQSTIFDCIKLAITQQASSTLASTAFSTLSHLLKRLKIQDASGTSIKQLAPRLLPSLQDRLGDLREPVRHAASQALTDIYPYLTADVEELVRDEAMPGTNVRAKETAIQWVVRMHNEEGMAFKGYVPSIVARLEDADGNVRETAKSSLIDLFRNAPDRAKVDLKRQLKAYSVRHAIESQILAQINTPSSQTNGSTQHENDMAASTRSLPAVSSYADSTASEVQIPPSQEQAPIDPLYVHSQRELEDIFRDILPAFEGKETEHNWMPRDKAILKVRRLLKGNAPSEYHQTFMAGLKSISEGILKVANSLRTTMSSNGCQLVHELARTLGPALDPHVELFLQSFVKMSAATKHIAAENGRTTAEAIFQNCSYHSRLMQHIWGAAQEKNAQLRGCVPEWLKVILKRQASYKSQFEHSGGLELAEKCIKKGLDDANPKVKEGMRSAYWLMAKSWPDKAEAIMNKLDPKSRSALEKDPNNPNVALHASVSSVATISRASGVASRNTLREMMAEQRKAKAAARLGDRPNSAMATVSPMKAAKSEANLKHASRQPSNLSHTQRADRVVSGTSSVSATPSESTTGSKRSALMSGPVRRPRRPEIQRPQTADPYASKKLLRPETPASNASPANSPPKGTDRSNKSSIASSSAARNRSRVGANGHASPNASPVRQHQPLTHRSPVLSSSRPSSKHSNATQEEDMTMVVPSRGSIATIRGGYVPTHKRFPQAQSVDSGVPSPSIDGEEDDHTIVVGGGRSRSGSPLAYRSPLKAMFDEARDKLERSASPPLQEAPMGSLDEAVESEAVRRESPVRAAAQPVDVQVYEDPFEADTADTPIDGERKVLGELPVNENAGLLAASQMASTSPERNGDINGVQSSPERSEILKSKKLLSSGIERIRTKTLDAHGLRRVQDLAKSPLDIWDGGRKYDELMTVLLEYLQTFDQDSRQASQPASKTFGLKAQAIGLVRALLTVHRKYATAWHAKTLTALLVFRRTIDSTSHLLTDLEKTTEDIVRQATPEPCVVAILDLLPSISNVDSNDHGASRSIAMALVLLRQLLSSKAAVPSQLKVQLTQAAAKYLDAPDAEVRKADVELASELFELFGSSKAEFWSEFKGTDEGRLGLLTYYIARNSKREGRSKPVSAV